MQNKKNKQLCTQYGGYVFLEDYLRSDLNKVKTRFIKEYPFIDPNLVNNVVADVSKKINTNYITDFIDNIIDIFPYFSKHKESIIKKYSRNIFTIIKENCTINVADNNSTYDLYVYEGKEYYIDNKGDLYDDEHIYVGYVSENTTIMFIKRLPNLSILD